MSKIKVTEYGTIHYHAVCRNCDFTAGIFAEGLPTPQAVRVVVRNHVRSTVHTVDIESGQSKTYSLVED